MQGTFHYEVTNDFLLSFLVRVEAPKAFSAKYRYVLVKCKIVSLQAIVMSYSYSFSFVCRRCTDVEHGTEEPVDIICNEVETVKGFCYLGDRQNASGACETAVTSRVKIGWMIFKESGELLRGRFSLRIKGMVYHTCVRSAVLYGSETWCLKLEF